MFQHLHTTVQFCVCVCAWHYKPWAMKTQVCTCVCYCRCPRIRFLIMLLSLAMYLEPCMSAINVVAALPLDSLTFEPHVFCSVISHSCFCHCACHYMLQPFFGPSRFLHCHPFSHMAPTFNPRVPKKGRNRQVLKRPASTKNKDWKRVPYVRDPCAVPYVRADQNKWKRSLADILKCSATLLVSMLRADGLPPAWEGALCPRCHCGVLSKLVPDPKTRAPKHRCSAKKCHVYIHPHHAHPLFVEGVGPGSKPLTTQAAMLMLLLNRVPHAAIHRLLHANHKSIEAMDKRLGELRDAYVVHKEKSICFGDGQKWADIEADEATLRTAIYTGSPSIEATAGQAEGSGPRCSAKGRVATCG